MESFATGIPLAVDDSRAAAAVEGYRDRVARGEALLGAARVVLEGPDFKLNRPQRIAVARPGSLRFEVLGLFDVLAAMLVTDGLEFGFYDASTGDVMKGEVTPELLWELAGLDLEAHEVVDLLLAAPLPSPTLAPGGVWLEPDAGITVAFTQPGSDLAGGGQIFRFDAEGLLREMRSMDPGWITRYQALFEGYGELDARILRRFPMLITIRSPQHEATARFEWKRVSLSDHLPDALFELPGDRRAGS